MNEPEQTPASRIEEIWPPAPLRDAKPTSAFLAVEGIEISQSGGRLVVVNKSVRRMIPVEVCLFTGFFSLPCFLYWFNPFHHPVQSRLLPYLISYYYHIFPVCLLMLVFIVCVWRAFYVDHSSGVVTLNKLDRTINANGREYSLSEVEAVRITLTQNAAGTSLRVALVWNGSNPVPPWPKALTLVMTEVNTTILGTLRHEENAKKVAAAIAEFVGVPVQHRTLGENNAEK